MARRIHVPQIRPGEIELDPAQAHHARDVLRLTEGAEVEVFDDAGAVGPGVLMFQGAKSVAVRVDRAEAPAGGAGFRLTIAAAVPKGDRADWMVEKLSELGAAEFVPLAAARSVVLPEGKSKRERWARIATEAAKQSRRAGVMRVGELTPVARVVEAAAGTGAPAGAEAGATGIRAAWYLSTEPDAVPVGEAARALSAGASLTALVGPEGGWTEHERRIFDAARLTPVRLTATILRVETAAVAVAAVVGSLLAPSVAFAPLPPHAPPGA